MIVSWYVFCHWTEQFRSHTNIRKEAYDEAHDGVSSHACDSNFTEVLWLLHLVLNQEDMIVSIKQGHGYRYKRAKLENLVHVVRFPINLILTLLSNLSGGRNLNGLSAISRSTIDTFSK